MNEYPSDRFRWRESSQITTGLGVGLITLDSQRNEMLLSGCGYLVPCMGSFNVHGYKATSETSPLYFELPLNHNILISHITSSTTTHKPTTLPDTLSGVSTPMELLQTMRDELITAHTPSTTTILVLPAQPGLGMSGPAHPAVFDESVESLRVWATQAARAAVGDQSTFMVAGAKNTGKSTFSHMLLNALLQRHDTVTLVDTDPGQGASPAALSRYQVSAPILGRDPLPSERRWLGYITPKGDLSAHIHVCAHLVSGHTPMVINTPGWNTGFGSDTLRGMMAVSEPDLVVVMSRPGQLRLFATDDEIAGEGQRRTEGQRIEAIRVPAGRLLHVEGAKSSKRGRPNRDWAVIRELIGSNTGISEDMHLILKHLEQKAPKQVRLAHVGVVNPTDIDQSTSTVKVGSLGPYSVGPSVVSVVGGRPDCVPTLLDCSVVGIGVSEQRGEKTTLVRYIGLGFVRGIRGEGAAARLLILTSHDCTGANMLLLPHQGSLQLASAVWATSTGRHVDKVGLRSLPGARPVHGRGGTAGR
eukprot:gnl/Dysnectes_brevis/1838_a2108_860.p1 GENE.gnl/Dysnectes_brevis/1838_a2108_860~~gnl/Dysnectes_brevis/1838_a2108_860.p1  ORF type:complete len:529 (+),score=123.25 gnl/Dysnectes_brevis/1838_a2108_860:38-1624(+)